MIRGVAVATSAKAAASATRILAEHGSAADAVLGGFFAEAGDSPEVLLAGITTVVFGGGAGSRAFDGRPCQPGLSAQRPRGFKTEAEIPEAGHVAAPRTILSSVLLHAKLGRLSFSSVVREGVENAKAAGAKQRAQLIEEIGRSKAAAASAEDFVLALLSVGGASSGGALTREDLLQVPPEVEATRSRIGFIDHGVEGAFLLRAPWSEEAQPHLMVTTSTVIAVDSWGMIAALSFARPDSVMVPSLEVGLPKVASPVRRGVTREPPGDAINLISPLAILDRGPDLRVVLGVETSRLLVTQDSLAPIATSIPLDAGLREFALRAGAPTVCIASEPRGPRVVGSSPSDRDASGSHAAR